MKKLTLILTLIFFISCGRERLLPKYKGWVVIEHAPGWHNSRLIQKGDDIKHVELYEVDYKFQIGDTIK
jgi:hypothetical protein